MSDMVDPQAPIAGFTLHESLVWAAVLAELEAWRMPKEQDNA